MTIKFMGDWYAYKSNGVSLIGIYPSKQLADAAVLAWAE